MHYKKLCFSEEIKWYFLKVSSFVDKKMFLFLNLFKKMFPLSRTHTHACTPAPLHIHSFFIKLFDTYIFIFWCFWFGRTDDFIFLCSTKLAKKILLNPESIYEWLSKKVHDKIGIMEKESCTFSDREITRDRNIMVF